MDASIHSSILSKTNGIVASSLYSSFDFDDIYEINKSKKEKEKGWLDIAGDILEIAIPIVIGAVTSPAGGVAAGAAIKSIKMSKPIEEGIKAVPKVLKFVAGPSDIEEVYSIFDARKDVTLGMYAKQMQLFDNLEVEAKEYGIQDRAFEALLRSSSTEPLQVDELMIGIRQIARKSGYLIEDLNSILYQVTIQNPEKTNRDVLRLVQLLTDYGIANSKSVDDIIDLASILSNIELSGFASENDKVLLNGMGITFEEYQNNQQWLTEIFYQVIGDDDLSEKYERNDLEFLLNNISNQYGPIARDVRSKSLLVVQNILSNLESEKLNAWNRGYEDIWLSKSDIIIRNANRIQDDMVIAYEGIGYWQGELETQRLIDYLSIMESNFDNRDLSQMSGQEIAQMMLIADQETEVLFQLSPYGEQLNNLRSDLLNHDYILNAKFPQIARKHLELSDQIDRGGRRPGLFSRSRDGVQINPLLDTRAESMREQSVYPWPFIGAGETRQFDFSPIYQPRSDANTNINYEIKNDFNMENHIDSKIDIEQVSQTIIDRFVSVFTKTQQVS